LHADSIYLNSVGQFKIFQQAQYLLHRELKKHQNVLTSMTYKTRPVLLKFGMHSRTLFPLIEAGSLTEAKV